MGGKHASRVGRTVLSIASVSFLVGGSILRGANAIGQDRPNIVRISAENVGPHLAAYGDPYANTPHLDSLTDRGMTHRYVGSNLPVCASAPFY